MPSSPSLSPVEFGLIGFLLILIWHVLNIGKQLFLAKQRDGQTTPCHADPTYAQRLRDIHEYVEDTGHRIDRGEFSCRWDREEVRDMLDVTKRQNEVSQRQVVAMEAMIQEMRLLRQELVLTRNGRH